MASDLYPLGIDLAWLAVDRGGHVAAFITGGEGPIPINLLDPDVLTDDDIEQRILSMPPVSLVRITRPGVESNSFAAIAERGLYVYDWTDVHRTATEEVHVYELVAAPTSPLKIAELPAELASVAALNAIPTADFVTAITLDVCQSVRCLRCR